MDDLMTFPDTWEEFEQDYGFTDGEQVYTNGSRLIQSFRVKQWLDHISAETKAETDTISRQAAIDKLKREEKIFYSPNGLRYLIGAIRDLPSAQPEVLAHGEGELSAQPEQPSEIQDILDYLDTALHPIISPEHWSVYSELHDMISTLPSAQPDRKKGKWILHIDDLFPEESTMECNQCHEHQPVTIDDNFCPNCGAQMIRGES